MATATTDQMISAIHDWIHTLRVSLLVGFGSIPPGISGFVRFLALLSAFSLSGKCVAGLLEQLFEFVGVRGLLIEIASLLKLCRGGREPS